MLGSWDGHPEDNLRLEEVQLLLRSPTLSRRRLLYFCRTRAIPVMAVGQDILMKRKHYQILEKALTRNPATDPADGDQHAGRDLPTRASAKKARSGDRRDYLEELRLRHAVERAQRRAKRRSVAMRGSSAVTVRADARE